MQTKAFLTDYEIKDASGIGSFKGYASTFGTLDREDDIVEPGAFGQINPKRVRLLWQHRQSEPIGVWDTLREDSRGLYAEGRLNLKSARGQEAYELLKMGGLNEMSIGFQAVHADRIAVKGKTARRLKKVNLFEISLVSIPANPEAIVTDVKSLTDVDPMTIRDFERSLRDAGLSRKMAQILAAEGLGGVEGYLESLLREAAAVSCKEAQIILDGGYRRFVAAKSSQIEDESGDDGDGDVRSRVHLRDADGEPEGSIPQSLSVDPVTLAAIDAVLAISGD